MSDKLKIAIISPHVDDAIFSLGNAIAWFQKTAEITVISPFAGIPSDPVGFKKHTTLRAEHEEACKIMGVSIINGDFFDDVYGLQNSDKVEAWIRKVTEGFDNILVPLGIHHPDHILVRNICVSSIEITGFYEELPYRILYPELRSQVVQEFTGYRGGKVYEHNPLKEQAVKAYASQIAPHLFPQLFVDERIWI